MLVSSIFSIPHNVLYDFQNKFQFLGLYVYFIACKHFEFGQVQNFVVW